MPDHNITIALQARDNASAALESFTGRAGAAFLKFGMISHVATRAGAGLMEAYAIAEASAARNAVALTADFEAAATTTLDLQEKWKHFIGLFPGGRLAARAFFDAFGDEAGIKRQTENLKLLGGALEKVTTRAAEWRRQAAVAVAESRGVAPSEVGRLQAGFAAEDRAKALGEDRAALAKANDDIRRLQVQVEADLEKPAERRGAAEFMGVGGSLAQTQLNALIKQREGLRQKIADADAADAAMTAASRAKLDAEGREAIAKSWDARIRAETDGAYRLDAARRAMADEAIRAEEADTDRARAAGAAAWQFEKREREDQDRARREHADKLADLERELFAATHSARQTALRDLDRWLADERARNSDRTDVLAALQDVYGAKRAKLLLPEIGAGAHGAPLVESRSLTWWTGDTRTDGAIPVLKEIAGQGRRAEEREKRRDAKSGGTLILGEAN